MSFTLRQAARHTRVYSRRRSRTRDIALAMTAATCALADGVTTLVSLANGGIERNPLIGTHPSPTLMAALTLCKMLAVFLALQTPAVFRVTFLVGAIAVWGGVSVNNLLVATSVPDPVPMICGLLAGLALLRWAGRQLTLTPAGRTGATAGRR